MERTFTRSGGFAGRATNVSGTVKIMATTAHVSADGSNYSRDLSAAEASELKKVVDEVLKHAARVDSGARDSFQYDVVVHEEDGVERTIKLAVSGLSQGAQPSALAEWIQRETQQIWQHRIAKKTH